MTTEELYREVPCRRCGKMKLKSSSFCPHCGHVHEEGWLERLRDRLGGTRGPGEPRSRLGIIVASIVVAVAAVLAANAISEGRYGDLITIAVMLLISIRAFFRQRKGPEAPEETSTELSAERTDSRVASDELATHYSCENCGMSVDGEATECPKCGTRFA